MAYFIEIKISRKNHKMQKKWYNVRKSKEEIGMELFKVNSDNFDEEVLNSDKTVLIDFYADWCGPCKMFAPIIDEVANENQNIKVVKINIDDNQDIAAKYQIMSIPTLVIVRNGNEVARSVGVIDKDKIIELTLKQE